MGKWLPCLVNLYIALSLDAYFSFNGAIGFFRFLKFYKDQGNYVVSSCRTTSYADTKRQQLNYKVYSAHIQ